MLAECGEDEAIQKSAERLRVLSQEIKQILVDHEREHRCGQSKLRLGELDGKGALNDSHAWMQWVSSSDGRNGMSKEGLSLTRWVMWAQESGQDLIEYALMAGFVEVAAGATMPGVAASISRIFSKVASVLSSANAS